MIVRLIAVDPNPRPDSRTDLVVYQVPEKSRELELLIWAFERLGISWVELPSKPRKDRKKIVPINPGGDSFDH